MTNLSWATQTAIQTLLSNDCDIISLTAQEDGSAGVWNYEADPNAMFPYITFQQATSQFFDTLGHMGKDMLWDVNVWSNQPGESETTNIFDRITTILNQSPTNPTPLSYDGVNFAMVHEATGPRPIPDPEKGIRRMTATYRIKAQIV
jgi:hypothetical protein